MMKKNAKKGILTQAGECRYRNLMLGAHFNTLLYHFDKMEQINHNTISLGCYRNIFRQ